MRVDGVVVEVHRVIKGLRECKEDEPFSSGASASFSRGGGACTHREHAEARRRMRSESRRARSRADKVQVGSVRQHTLSGTKKLPARLTYIAPGDREGLALERTHLLEVGVLANRSSRTEPVQLPARSTGSVMDTAGRSRRLTYCCGLLGFLSYEKRVPSCFLSNNVGHQHPSSGDRRGGPGHTHLSVLRSSIED